MSGVGSVTNHFPGWLYRPFVDLGPWQAGGNPVTLALQMASHALADQQNRVMQNTGVALPSFRRTLLRATSLTRYLVDDPRDLDETVRTADWQLLCDHLDVYERLDGPQRLRTLWVLNRLTMHSAILRYEEWRRRRTTGQPSDRRADLMCEIARISLFHDGSGALDLTGLERLEATAPPGSWEHVEATYLLAQTSAKTLDDVLRLARHLDTHLASIEAVDRPEHDRAKLLSRYHRLAAFLPQLTGDLDGMVRQMDAAESHCELMSRDEPHTRADWELFRYALLESRVKERFACNDFPGAERYALALVDHAPSTPNSWLTLGQARIERGDLEGALESCRWAALLGPHIAAEAEFMAGQCLEQLGRPDGARNAYVRSLTADPLAASSAERLHESGLAAANPYLADWVTGRVRDMHGSDGGEADRPKGYQAYDGVLGGRR
ncbi:tetratricopeptide repeat protein [Streptomyces pseudogriseolus]|uniref:tetratricopeptide repeat protein n=1 Tax=Streptomyces pseudogriseolus TaxID=36817 RepID=UPI003FA31ABB